MKILVTGGSGFIGSHLIARLLRLNHSVVNLDKTRRQIKEVKFYKADINHRKSLEKIFQREKPEVVYHLAAKTGVRESINQPQVYFQTNVLGTLNLLEAAVKYGVKGFFFASSSSVYGNQKKAPFKETDCADKPISPYAASKRAAELLIYAYHQLYQLSAVIFRLFTVYGPAGRKDMAPFLFTREINRSQSIKKFGSGQSQRDYVYIDDVVDGLAAALEKKFNYEIINLGSGQSASLNNLIRLIEKLLAKKARVKKLPQQPGDAIITWADISRAKKLLSYQPKISLELGMKRFVNWYLENERD